MNFDFVQISDPFYLKECGKQTRTKECFFSLKQKTVLSGYFNEYEQKPWAGWPYG